MLIALAFAGGVVLGLLIGFVLMFGFVKVYDWMDETERPGRH